MSKERLYSVGRAAEGVHRLFFYSRIVERKSANISLIQLAPKNPKGLIRKSAESTGVLGDASKKLGRN
jgi:hypothetical protein